MSDALQVPGMAPLVGRGVYTAIPDALAIDLRGRHAVVTGAPAACADAALRLTARGCDVTIVTRERASDAGFAPDTRRALRRCRVRRRHGAELACVDGLRWLEAVVLRRLSSGRLEACEAALLLLLVPLRG